MDEAEQLQSPSPWMELGPAQLRWWDHGLISDLVSQPGKVSKLQKRRSEKGVKMQGLGMNRPYRSEALSCLFVKKINRESIRLCCLSMALAHTLCLSQTHCYSSTCLAPLRHWFPPVLYLADTCLRASCLKLSWIWWMSFICSSSFQIAETSLIFVAMYLVSKRELSARCNFLSRFLADATF